jgi:hypothetical protein
VLLRVRSDGGLASGEDVVAGGEPVGTLTSADGTSAIARIAWSARDLPLETSGGAALERLEPA